MTVIVEGKEYTQLSSCDTTSAGGTWSAGAEDTDQYKEGAGSLSATLKNAGRQSVTFTPTTPPDLTNKHLRVWFIGTQGGKMSIDSGIQISIADASNTCYWYLGGRNTYAGGWINLVVDIESTPDEGTKPLSLTGITTIGIHVLNESSTKNAVNTWWDNLTVSEGLIAYDKDGEAGFGFDDIYNYENQTASGGFGIIRKIGGVYFLNGSLEIGDKDSTRASGCTFSDTSKIAIFEDRMVTTGLYEVALTGNSTNGCSAIFGSKSAGKGIAGCIIQSETGSLGFAIKADGDYVDTGQFLNCSFINASGTWMSGYATGAMEALSCTWNSSYEVHASDATIQYCNFIDSPDRAIEMIATGHNISGCNFIGCSTGIHITGLSGNYESNIVAHSFSACGTDLESDIVSGIITGNLLQGADATTFYHSAEGTGVLINAVTLQITVQDSETVGISGAAVGMYRMADRSEVFKDTTNSDGLVSTSYNYSSPENIRIEIRKSSGSPKYFPVTTYGTIEGNFSLTYAMTEDNIA